MTTMSTFVERVTGLQDGYFVVSLALVAVILSMIVLIIHKGGR